MFDESASLSRRERFVGWLMGLRRGFGDGVRVCHVTARAGFRSGLNWVFPGVIIAIAFVLLMWYKFMIPEDSSLGGMMVRVFMFDYGLFMLGGLSAWDVARRWRNSSDQIEEMSLTPLPPAIVAHALLAPSILVWLALFTTFGILDTITPITAIRAWWDGDNLDPATPAGGLSFLIQMAATISLPIAMAWFHFESVRVAHWMFAVHLLPRISLLRAAFSNFVLMTVLVLVLSGLGSAITGVVWILFAIAGAAATGILTGSGNGDWGFESLSVAALATVPGALIIAAIKRSICHQFERQFVQAYLLYQWWGAGEARQPSTYPPAFQAAMPFWHAYFGMMEEEAADLPMHKRHYTRRFFAERQRMPSQVRAAEIGAEAQPTLPSRVP